MRHTAVGIGMVVAAAAVVGLPVVVARLAAAAGQAVVEVLVGCS